jgi:GNAT superfamily N-acetyltransferase
MYNVRSAFVDDARSIAFVHVESSKTTYSGLLPDDHLSRFSIENRERLWKETLEIPEPGTVTLVGCNPTQEVVGFVCGGAERTGHLGCDGELYAIYLLQIAQRQGLGTLLVERFVHELMLRGFSSMAVWVLAANPFRKFYEALGGQFITEQRIERGGQFFLEVAYGWDDLGKFSRERQR